MQKNWSASPMLLHNCSNNSHCSPCIMVYMVFVYLGMRIFQQLQQPGKYIYIACWKHLKISRSFSNIFHHFSGSSRKKRPLIQKKQSTWVPPLIILYVINIHVLLKTQLFYEKTTYIIIYRLQRSGILCTVHNITRITVQTSLR